MGLYGITVYEIHYSIMFACIVSSSCVLQFLGKTVLIKIPILVIDKKIRIITIIITIRNGFGGLLFGGEGKCVLNKREWMN